MKLRDVFRMQAAEFRMQAAEFFIVANIWLAVSLLSDSPTTRIITLVVGVIYLVLAWRKRRQADKNFIGE